jgi:hypothetical protein
MPVENVAFLVLGVGTFSLLGGMLGFASPEK